MGYVGDLQINWATSANYSQQFLYKQTWTSLSLLSVLRHNLLYQTCNINKTFINKVVTYLLILV